MTVQEYLDNLLLTRTPIGLTSKIYIYDKDGKKIDFSDVLQIYGTNRLITLDVVETVVEKDFNHFYNRTGDIQVRNDDRFFNKPFPSTLKDAYGNTATFLKDANNLINVFKKPGTVSGTLVNNRYTYLEIVLEVDIFGGRYPFKVATLLLSKITTDTSATAYLITDGLVDVLINTPADNVKDGTGHWYLQRPLSFLIKEVLKKAFGVYNNDSGSADYRKVVLPPGFIIPRFVDLLITFPYAVLSSLGRPPIQTDENSDGEPDTYPDTSKITRAMILNFGDTHIYLGLDNEIWSFNITTWIFKKELILDSNYTIEQFRILVSTMNYDWLEVSCRQNVHDIIIESEKIDANLKKKNVRLYFVRIDQNTTVFSVGNYLDYTLYDSEFCYYPVTNIFFSTINPDQAEVFYIDDNNFFEQFPLATYWSAPLTWLGIKQTAIYSRIGNLSLRDSSIIVNVENNEKQTRWASENWFRFLNIGTPNYRIFDFTNIYIDVNKSAYLNYESINADFFYGSLKSLNLPVPFSQTVYFSSPGEVYSYKNVLDNTAIFIRESGFKTSRTMHQTDTVESYGALQENKSKIATFELSKGYFSALIQQYQTDFDDPNTIAENLDGSLNMYGSADFKVPKVRCVKFSLGQKGLNEIFNVGGTIYKICVVPAVVKGGRRFIEYYGTSLTLQNGTLHKVDVASWFQNAPLPVKVAGSARDIMDGLVFPTVSFGTLEVNGTEDAVGYTELYNIFKLHYKGRELQPLSTVVDSESNIFYMFAIAFETLDSNVFLQTNAADLDKQFDEVKYARLVVLKFSLSGSGFGSILLNSDSNNNKTPGTPGYDTTVPSFSTQDSLVVGDIDYYYGVSGSGVNNCCVLVDGIDTGVSIYSTLLVTGAEASADWAPASDVGPGEATIALSVDEGTPHDGTISTARCVKSSGSFYINHLHLQALTGTLKLGGNTTIHVVAKRGPGTPSNPKIQITLEKGAGYTVIGTSTETELSTIWVDYTLVVANSQFTISDALHVSIKAVFYGNSFTVDVTSVWAVVEQTNANKLLYKDHGMRLGTEDDSYHSTYNLLPTGNYGGTSIKKIAKKEYVYADIAILDSIIYGSGGTKRIYAAVLLLNNINEQNKDTVYTTSINQYAIWEINPTNWASPVLIKTLFYQPKNFKVSNGILYFILEGLGAVGTVDLSSKVYTEYGVGTAPIPDELMTHSEIAIKEFSSNPTVYAISSSSGRDRYKFEIPTGKYYLWQMSKNYVPMIELADFSGMSCEDILFKFCEMLNWIKGFDENGNFFMVSRSPSYSTPDLTLAEGMDTKYIDITQMENSTEGLINQCTVTPYRTKMGDISFDLTYKKRSDEDAYPDLTLDIEQRDVRTKSISMQCVRDGVVGIDSENIDSSPLFRWRLTQSETAIGLAIQVGGSATTLYLNSVFGGKDVDAGIHIGDIIKFQNTTTSEYVFRDVDDVDSVANSITINSGFGFTIPAGTNGFVLRSSEYYYSDEQAAVCTQSPQASNLFSFKVDSLENIGVGNVLQNPSGAYTIVRKKQILQDGTFQVTVSSGSFCTNGQTLRGYWSPLVSNISYEVGGTTVFVKIAIKDDKAVLQALKRTFMFGDYLLITCPGLTLESDETSKQTYIDLTSVGTYGLIAENGPDNKFLNRILARYLAERIVKSNSIPRFIGTVKAAFLAALKVVNVAAKRLFVVRVQNKDLFPLIQDTSVDFYVTSIKHSLNKRTTEFSVKGVKGIGES